MKTLIYQVSVGSKTPPPFYKTCINSVAKYCKKYNIDHIVQTEPIIRLRPVNSHRSEKAVERFGYLPHFEKANAFNYLDDYDKLAIVDADIFIRDITPNMFDELDDETTFAGVRECDMPLTRQFVNKVKQYSISQYGSLKVMKRTGYLKDEIPFYNTGLMLINSRKFQPYLNDDSPEEFVKRKEFERFVNGEGSWKWASDQTMLNWWFQKENISTKNLDWKWNVLYKGVKDSVLPEAYLLHFFLAAKLLKEGVNVDSVIEQLK